MDVQPSKNGLQPSTMPSRTESEYASTVAASGIDCSNNKARPACSGGRNANEIFGKRPSSGRKLAQKVASIIA